MTDFVLSQKEGSTIEWEQLDWMNQEIYKLDRIRNYANFLKQPLTLGMFVPCDEDGNVLKDCGLIPCYELDKYRKAKDRCLFEGFEFLDKNCAINNKFMIHFLNNEVNIEEHFESIITKISVQINTVEDLIYCKLKLSKTSLKQLEWI